jgi:imidazolonepropionase-like amidohydrolase
MLELGLGTACPAPAPAPSALTSRPAAPTALTRAYVWLDGAKPVGHGVLRVAGRATTASFTLDDTPGEARIEVELDDRGVPVRYAAAHAGVPGETMRLVRGTATWLDKLGAGSAAWSVPTYYVPFGDDPFATARLAGALLASPARRLALAPRGEATLESLATLRVEGGAGPQVVTAYAVIGLGLTPQVAWLDAEHQLFAGVDEDGYGPIVAGYEAASPMLVRAANVALARRAERVAAAVTHRPRAGLVIRHARLFDPTTLAVAEDTSVVIEGGKITAVGRNVAVPAGAEFLDARGRFVMPGLWDSHAHLFGRARPILQLAAGVTTVREMGNETDLPAMVRRIDAGLEVGPRALMTVRIGWDPEPGMPVVPQVHDAAEAQRIVETYAARGYVQIKVLDDFDPRWVPVLAELAHARGLRLSGHVPSKMTPRALIEAGADEIQHVPSLLKGVTPKVIGAPVHALLALMASRHATLDPTLAQFEPAARDGALPPVAAAVAARLPPLELRSLQRNLPDAETRARWTTLFPVFQQVVKAAHDAGVTVVPGTDSLLAGFLLRRELALYVEAGIPAARVLRMVTYDAARNMRREASSGSIAPGKDADLIIIDGDPTRDIADLARVQVVIKQGWRFDPAALERLVSLAPAG